MIDAINSSDLHCDRILSNLLIGSYTSSMWMQGSNGTAKYYIGPIILYRLTWKRRKSKSLIILRNHEALYYSKPNDCSLYYSI